jgi:hypothetical protein
MSLGLVGLFDPPRFDFGKLFDTFVVLHRPIECTSLIGS